MADGTVVDMNGNVIGQVEPPADMIGINERFIRRCLSSELYLKVLAVNKNRPEVLSAIKGENKTLLPLAMLEVILLGILSL